MCSNLNCPILLAGRKLVHTLKLFGSIKIYSHNTTLYSTVNEQCIITDKEKEKYQ